MCFGYQIQMMYRSSKKWWRNTFRILRYEIHNVVNIYGNPIASFRNTWLKNLTWRKTLLFTKNMAARPKHGAFTCRFSETPMVKMTGFLTDEEKESHLVRRCKILALKKNQIWARKFKNLRKIWHQNLKIILSRISRYTEGKIANISHCVTWNSW